MFNLKSINFKKFESRIILLMALVTLVITTTAVMAYFSLSGIVSSIDRKARPDRTLANAKELVYYINSVENNINLYSLTGKDYYLEPFDSIEKNIERRLKPIQFSSDTVDGMLLKDSLQALTNEKLMVWDEMIELGGQISNHDAFEKLYRKFGRSANKADELTRFFSERQKDALNQDEITVEIAEIEKQYLLENQQLILKEFELIHRNKTLSVHLNDLVKLLDSRTNKSLLQEMEKADARVNKTFFWLAMFCVAAVILVLITVYFIFSYLRKSNDYQNALHDAKHEAERLSHMKETFISRISKELQTPINDIHNQSLVLMNQPVDFKVKQRLLHIHKSAEYLIKQVKDLLDFSKLRTGKSKLKKVKFSPKKVIDKTSRLFKDLANQKQLQLKYDTQGIDVETCIGDPDRLRQIISHLYSNAIKFTHNGSVFLKANSKIIETNKILLTISVEDTGIGIEKEEIETLFNEFGKKVENGKGYEGAGFGLALVRQLVEMHHGKIEAISSKNDGSVFTCKLPYVLSD